MKSILQYLKSNALVIALLGVVGYQQVMLNEIAEDTRWTVFVADSNNDEIVQIHTVTSIMSDQLNSMETELMLTKIGVDALQYQ